MPWHLFAPTVIYCPVDAAYWETRENLDDIHDCPAKPSSHAALMLDILSVLSEGRRRFNLARVAPAGPPLFTGGAVCPDGRIFFSNGPYRLPDNACVTTRETRDVGSPCDVSPYAVNNFPELYRPSLEHPKPKNKRDGFYSMFQQYASRRPALLLTFEATT